MRFPHVLIACALLCGTHASGQPRSMTQDSTLNNLLHPVGQVTAESGTLGHVRKIGDGPRKVLLIPGLGFGGGIWAEFMERHRSEYTMYAVTLPGFGNTPPLPMPPGNAGYADIPWTTSALDAMVKLMDQEGISSVTVMAHWALGTQLALRLALDVPSRVDAVVLIGGVLKSYYESTPAMMTWTPEQRARFADGMAQRWFKTVTRRTWDDNNFMSYDYAVNPRRGLFLWREAQSPSLPVWIRYLLEFYTTDLSTELKNLRVPALIVQPGFDDPDFYVEEGRNYMRNLCLDSWRGAGETTEMLTFVTIPHARLFVMDDMPAALDSAVSGFLSRLKQ